jgi:hypothetical protein
MTRFRIINKNSGDPYKAIDVGEAKYKRVIRELDEAGSQFRVGTEYQDGDPVKILTILRPT